jgi:hypothetical protein
MEGIIEGAMCVVVCSFCDVSVFRLCTKTQDLYLLSALYEFLTECSMFLKTLIKISPRLRLATLFLSIAQTWHIRSFFEVLGSMLRCGW